MNKLKPEVEMAILRNAKRYARMEYQSDLRHAHEAGATPWAEMAQKLAEALEFYAQKKPADPKYRDDDPTNYEFYPNHDVAIDALRVYQQFLKGEADE